MANSRTKTRIQLDLPEKSMARLNTLKDMTDASSTAEVIRNAIQLYEDMVKEAASGSKFYTKDEDGNLSQYKVFV